MFGRSTSSFDRLLEKATSQLLLEPDWTSNLMICDAIRQGDTNPKYAVTAIKKKFYHQNPHAALFALQVMETCVKNCGDLVHQEVATKAFMEEMRDLVKQTTDDNIKNKVLELIQTWGTVFKGSPKYRIVTDTLMLMKAEGWKFPPIVEADAMFEADTAPEWAEGDVCRRCRVQFSTFTRQHHCRACGQVFCAKCSAKSCLLPKFGIEREVRVCDACFDKYGPKDETESPQHQPKQLPPLNSNIAAMKEGASSLPEEYLSSPLSKQPQQGAGKQQPQGQAQQQPGGKSEAELKEEEELQLVLALSMSEAEEKEKIKKKQTNDMIATIENNKNKVSNGVRTPPEETADPEMARYLNRDYWEAKKDDSGSSVGNNVEVDAGIPAGVALAKQNILASMQREHQAVQGSGNYGKETASEGELEEFTASLRTQLEIFVNRMKSNSSRGRPIANDSSVQSLFVNMMSMHSRLVKYIQEQEDARLHYEGLQDKLTQVRDARAALDALREEERERRRREAEEAERQRQIQMAYKLDQMRKKKAEYLEYQRQMALKRMAEQESQMAMMKEASMKNYMNQQQSMHNMFLPPYGQQGMYPGAGMPPGYAQIQQQPGMMPGMMVGAPGQYGGGIVQSVGHEQQPQSADQAAYQQQFYHQQGGENFNMQGMSAALPQVSGTSGGPQPPASGPTLQTLPQAAPQMFPGQPVSGIGQSEGQQAGQHLPAGHQQVPGMVPPQPGIIPQHQSILPGQHQQPPPGITQPTSIPSVAGGGMPQPSGGIPQPSAGMPQPSGGMPPGGAGMAPPPGGVGVPPGGMQQAGEAPPPPEDSLIVF